VRAPVRLAWSLKTTVSLVFDVLGRFMAWGAAWVTFTLLLSLTGCHAGSFTSHVEGVVVDHRSGEPIVGATVVLERQGWGRSDSGGYIVWDKRYRTTVVTDDRGTFSVQVPGPALLVGGGPSVLLMEADGFQPLRTRVEGGAQVSLHTIPDYEERSPGGTARMGQFADGRAFGWSFVENRAVTEPDRADLLAEGIAAADRRVILTVPPGGGLLFIPISEQEIGIWAEGHLLRFIDAPPQEPEADRLALGRDPGTIFLRTRDRRYAKLAWEPSNAFSFVGEVPGLEETAANQVHLPFIYRPLPGHYLPFQPPPRRVDPLFAAAAAELDRSDEEGAASRRSRQGPRQLILELRTSDGSVLDRQVVTLEPDRPQEIQVRPQGIDATWRYQNLLLRFDEDGLPRVGLRIDGPTFNSSFMPQWVTRRLETEFQFDAYVGTGSMPVEMTLAVWEGR
jgi:hypothetical protein